MNTISTQRVLIVMAAVFLLGIAIGLLLYPSIGSPTIVFSVLMSLSGMLLVVSLRWERHS